MTAIAGLACVRVGVLAMLAALGCAGAKEPVIDAPNHVPVATTAPSEGLAPSPNGCATPPCSSIDGRQSSSEPATHALAPYEPERFEPAPDLSAEDAVRILDALAHSAAPYAQRDASCSRLQAPLVQTCDAEFPAMLALATRPPLRHSTPKAVFDESMDLAKGEGCKMLPAGAMRWMRARRHPQCAPELAISALAQGGPALTPKLRGLLVGEAIADQCLRRVEPMPPFRGKFTPERFSRWQTLQLAPWHERSLKRLDECHEVAASIPVGAPGRASALIGYAQTVAKFIVSHRAAPLEKALAQDYELRTAYLAALDDVTAPFAERRSAANDEARREAVIEGAYADYVHAFEPLVPRQEPLSVLDLPKLPPMTTNERGEWLLSHLPVQVISFGPAESMCGDGGSFANTQSVAALLRRGLPLEVRARVGAALAHRPATDPERQGVHLMLAAGLLRLGLVTQDRAVIERAAYELRYAGAGVHQSWLTAVTRAILTPGMDQALFPRFARSMDTSARSEPDLSGFTQELLDLSASHPEYADIAVDRAILGSAGPTSDHYLKLGYEAVTLAKRPGVSPALVGCVNRHFGRCYSDFVGGTRQESCACTPFPWRVE